VNASKIGWIRKGCRYEYTLTSFEKALLVKSVSIRGSILRRTDLERFISLALKLKNNLNKNQY